MREYTLKRWLLAAYVSALLLPVAANSAGLGRLTVLSALGQPLNAEVELVSAQKGETLTARLSSIDTYQQANLTFNAALVGARVIVERRPNGQPYLRVTTPRPVNEPFADLLIEVNSEHGKVTRQYTVLLDPPGYGRSAAEIPPPVVAAPAARSAPSEARALPSQAAPAPAAAAPGASAEAGAPGPAAAPRGTPAARSRARSEPAPAAEPSSGGKQYGPVKRGETLGGIARNVKPEGATLEQTLVSLYRHNPDAFIKKNMNLVKSGRILKVPEAGEMASVPQRDAVQEVRLQVADFNSFRGRIADRAASAPEAGGTTSGRIGAKIAEAPTGEPRDTVRLSRGEAGKGKGGAERLRALEEEAVAREKSLADANERIAALEKTIKDLQRRAELQTAPAGKAAAPQPTPAPAAKVEAPPIAVAPVIPPPPAQTPAPPPAEPPQAAAPDAGKGAPPADAGQGAPDTTAAAGDTVPPAANAKAPPPAPAPVQERDFLETVMDEPLYLAAGGAVVVLGGLALVAARRRRAAGDGGRVKIAPTLSSGSGRDDSTDSLTVASSPAAAPPTTPKAPPSTPPAPSTRSPAQSAAGTAAAATARPASGTAAAGLGAGAAATRSAAAAGSTADDNDLDFNAATRSADSAAADRGRPTASGTRGESSPTKADALRAQPETPLKPVAPAARAEPPLKAASPSAKADSPMKTAAPGARAESPLKASAPDARAEPPLKVGAPAATADSSLNEGLLGPRVDPVAPTEARTLRAEPPVNRDIPRTPAPEFKVPPARAPEAPSADTALPDFALDIPPAGQTLSTGSAPAPAAREPAPLDFNMDFNLEPLPPIDTPSDTRPAGAASSASGSNDLDFKLGDLNLTFGGTPTPTPAKDDHWYDVQQKFDLAKAYEEMGDKDGARDILQEVLKEGDAEQQDHAKKLLGTLG